MAKTDYKSVDHYIASQPKASQAALERVRAAIRKAVPAADEVISYQIPAYKLEGARLIYFAGWKQHYSLYPVFDELADAFKGELGNGEIKSHTLRFPLSEPVPVKLIERIAKFRLKELAASAKAKTKSSKKRQTTAPA